MVQKGNKVVKQGPNKGPKVKKIVTFDANDAFEVLYIRKWIT